MEKMRIEFGELKVSEKGIEYLLQVAREPHAATAIPWPLSEKFEQKWGTLFGYKYNVATTNGTAADVAACQSLYGLGAQLGDEVIAPALAFVAVGESIVQAGLKPVFVDVERETLNINPDLIERSITPRTRAIMAVHTMGKPCEMDIITRIARDNKLKIIEDSCEAHGAQYKGRYVGHWGDMATFSFFMAHLICCGEGGMVSTNDSELADKLRSVKAHGRRYGSQYFDHELLGGNFKMSDFHAALGLAEIESFWDTFNTRKTNLDTLLELTRDLEKFAHFIVEGEDEVVCPHGFSLTLRDPRFDYNALHDFLMENGIRAKRNFGSIPTQHKAFAYLGHKLGDFPEAEYIGDNGLHFGVHQYLTKSDLEFASDTLHKYFARFK